MKTIDVRRMKVALVMAGFVGSVSAGSAQNWVFNQLPDLTTNGIDYLATFNKGTPVTKKVVLADQFVPSASGQITDIRFWGGWYNNVVDPTVKFSISFFASNPAGTGGIPYDRPGKLLWTGLYSPSPVSATLAPLQSFWDPAANVKLGTDTQSLQYDWVNPVGSGTTYGGQSFSVVAGQAYWMSIQAQAADTMLFGWNTRETVSAQSFVSAVYGTNTSFGSVSRAVWTDLPYPGTLPPGEKIDLAFALETPEPATVALVGLGIAALLLRRRSV